MNQKGQESIFAFTLIELLVVISIIAILATLMIPSLSAGIRKAKETKKTANLRSIYRAHHLYMIDNDGDICPTNDEVNYGSGNRNWRDLLAPYLAKASAGRGDANFNPIFHCPFFDFDPNNPSRTGIGLNRNPGLPGNTKGNAVTPDPWTRTFYFSNIQPPSLRMMIGDVTNAWFIASGNYTDVLDTTRHEKGTKGMFLMFDGSVLKLTKDEAEQSFSNPKNF